MNVVERMNDQDRKELVALAMKVATNQGLCSDTVNVLEEMGFTVEPTTVRVTISIDAEIPIGDTFDPDDWTLHYTTTDGNDFQVYANSGEVHNVEVQ